VPPDLTQLEKDNRYAVPDGRGVPPPRPTSSSGGNAPAAPRAGRRRHGRSAPGMRVERAATSAGWWSSQTPNSCGRSSSSSGPTGLHAGQRIATTGTMETDWAENRAKIPQDFIRNTIGKVFDSLYSTGERDKFRTRLERNADGSTEIYISHRGAEEV
jgi:outer membrane protein assembly factor BamC